MLDFIEEVKVVPYSLLFPLTLNHGPCYLYDLAPYQRLAGMQSLKRMYVEVDGEQKDRVAKLLVSLGLRRENGSEEAYLDHISALAEEHDPEGCYLLAKNYCLFPSLSEKDLMPAFYPLLKEASFSGIKEALLPYAECLLYSIGEIGKEKEGEEILLCHPSKEGYRELGHYYLRKGRPGSRSFFLKAYEMGDPFAAFPLGITYLRGEDGEKDLFKAYHCFEKARADEDERALSYLGLMTYEGMGCKKNEEKALLFFKEDSSNPYSLRKVGDILLQGKNKEKVKEAGIYYKKSASLGDEFAKLKLQELFALLSYPLQELESLPSLSYYKRRKLTPAFQAIAKAKDPKESCELLSSLGYPKKRKRVAQ